jgi:predicted nucleotidyltransferase
VSFDPESYAAGIRKLNAAERARIKASMERARGDAERLAAAILEKDPGVRRVILFGSVATGAARSEDFDIDLALDGGDVQAAMDLTEGLAFRVDLLSLARAPESVRRAILERGVVVGERSVSPRPSATER